MGIPWKEGTIRDKQVVVNMIAFQRIFSLNLVIFCNFDFASAST